MPIEQNSYFLPYQIRWIRDRSKLKIWEKSRRIGATYVQSYEDVLAAIDETHPIDVWFSSADETAGREYIRYCLLWVNLFEKLYQHKFLFKKSSLILQFNNGKSIHALSSNPNAFRSKGGKLVLDEFAFHRDPQELWKAALPIITWGFPARILSTYNGKNNKFYEIVTESKQGQSTWSLHSTNIEQAVAEGLADRIAEKKLSTQDQQNFILSCKDLAQNHETFMQEFMCSPMDHTEQFLPSSLIIQSIHSQAGHPEFYQKGDIFLGVDIARRNDHTVFWAIETINGVFWTREVVFMKQATFLDQEKQLNMLFEKYNIAQCVIDQTGIGEKPVEDARRTHGEHKVTGLIFTSKIKSHLAHTGRYIFERMATKIPDHPDIILAHKAIQRHISVSGQYIFFSHRDKNHGHADSFWAHMMALYAAQGVHNPIQPPLTGYGYTLTQPPSYHRNSLY